MYAHQTNQSSSEVQELRRAGGNVLRELRETAGLSQRQLAQLLGFEQYTFISQIENGRGRIPPDSYKAWASALNVDTRDLVEKILRYYDPITHEILFDGNTNEIISDDFVK